MVLDSQAERVFNPSGLQYSQGPAQIHFSAWARRHPALKFSDEAIAGDRQLVEEVQATRGPL